MTHDELMTKWNYLFTDNQGKCSLSYLETPEEWYPLINRLCHLIDEYLKRELDACPFYVVQIKEKFGGLRFYYEGGDKYVEGLVTMAESYSYELLKK
tara:strand:- start:186 stop:476 length:291 start_codon:yes stop_codon:yes gene_type:complete